MERARHGSGLRPAGAATVEPGLDVLALLQTLRAIRKGNFAARMPPQAGTLPSQVAETLNDIVENNQRLVLELERIGRVIGSVAKGDLSQKMPLEIDGRPLKGAFLQIANAINTMVDRLNSFASEVTRVTREVSTEGKLGGRAVVKDVAGIWRDLTDNVNFMAANLTDQVRDIAEATTAAADLYQIKEQAERLEKLNAELSRSNEELQQFACVASHDLREPLRKMASFADLLVARCADLDGSARQYARFIIDGAGRLQTMIDDLLEYSRVGREDAPLARLESSKALAKALSDLSISLTESKARVRRGELPAVTGDFARLTRLFQNLIANALKFRDAEQPVIEIGAEPAGRDWRFHVRDNGIGIDPAYHEKIFGVFNRLHPRDRYPGSGMGLAICRKIVEFHGGRIWVESRQGAGATFYFTLPRRRGSGALPVARGFLIV